MFVFKIFRNLRNTLRFKMMRFDRSFINVLLLGLSFMLVFTAFQTMGNIQKTMLNSIHEDDPSYTGDGYTSLAIIYAVFAICNWGAPSMISLIGPKFTMLYGALTYLLFIMNFLIPHTWLLYLMSVIIGTGAATIWTGQGNYLTLNSTSATISRNSGIFWALLQCSMFIGNLFVYIMFRGTSHIEKSSRTVVVWVLSVVCAVGIVIMVFLPKPKRSEDDPDIVQEPQRPIEALKGAARLFITRDMVLLSITFFYTGLELGFYSGVYSACVSFTKAFPARKELVGLSGIFIGLGEVIGGASFGLLGAKTTKWGRDPVVIGGFIIHAIAFFLIFLNLPNNSVFDDTDESAFIKSNVYLAMLCSFLLGFADACYNTQIYSILGGIYADQSASAFAIFKFIQSVAAAASFFYATHVALYPQLGILIVFAVIGTISFVVVEWKAKRLRRIAKDEQSTSSSE